MSAPGVIVVGSANIDLVMRLSHLPAAGETVTGGELERGFGGKGANAAVVAAGLGAEVTFLAAVGGDADGESIRADLRDHGVDGRLVLTKRAPTGVATVLVDQAGENAIAVASGANFLLAEQDVRDGLGETGAETGTVIVVNLEVGDGAVGAAASYARQHGCRLIIDPGPARPLPASVLKAASVLTPNRGELDVLAGGHLDADELLAGGVEAVAVTLGGDGVELHLAGSTTHIPAFAATAVDTTGAGDAFAAGLAVAMSENQPMEQAVRFAAATGALATEARGARGSLPDRAAVDALLERDRSAPPTDDE